MTPLPAGDYKRMKDFTTPTQFSYYERMMRNDAVPDQAIREADDDALETAVANSLVSFERETTHRLLTESQNPSSQKSDDKPRPKTRHPSSQQANNGDWLSHERQVTQLLTGKYNEEIKNLLCKHAMIEVPNSGESGDQKNNCFVISAAMLAFENYGESNKLNQQVNEIRKILVDEKLTKPNEQFTSMSGAAKRVVELINSRPGVKPKLRFYVISRVKGNTHIDQLGVPGGREVVIWDKGGHFVAVAHKSLVDPESIRVKQPQRPPRTHGK
ncbi:hypothetical protein [Paraburkholderia sp. CI3]|uniref:hypothetical protein n=1 Tax=Paraburkholderia sp. CI3 TaxID=2991060 RepID=UPI003D21C6C8